MPEVPIPTTPLAEVPERIWLTTQEAAKLLGLGKSTLEKARFYRRPDGPPFLKFGATVRYDRASLLSWAQARTKGAAR